MRLMHEVMARVVLDSYSSRRVGDEEVTMTSTSRTARLAGVLYVVVVLTGLFVILYVPGRLFVHGNPAATAANILAHQPLFRLRIAVGLVSECTFIALVLVLHHLLQEVGRRVAALMVLLVLLSAPLALLSEAYQLATLDVLRGADVLSALGEPQRQSFALLLLALDEQGGLVAQVFWGLWLAPLGCLVIRSGFLPRVLGFWLIANGLAYVVISLTGVLMPEHTAMVSKLATPALLGEVAFALWLLVVGAGARPPQGAIQVGR